MILAALGSLYGTASRWRRAWYARDPRRVKRLARRVVSVGNLRAGGSGKTPVVAFIAQLLVERGERPAILSRGYGRRSTEAVTIVSDGSRVVAGLDSAGDEPLMLAQKLHGVPVVVAADRYAAGCVAEERLGATIHVLDDGFQHVQLARDVDLLVVSEDDLAEPLLPAGRLREPLSAAAVADAVIVSTFDAKAAARVGLRLGVPAAFTMTRQLGEARLMSSGQPVLQAEPAIAVAGIARPERFFSDLIDAQRPIAETVVFPDHHRYRQHDVERIVKAACSVGTNLVFTTEKDAVRLAACDTRDLRVAAVPLQVTVGSGGAFASWLAEQLA